MSPQAEFFPYEDKAKGSLALGTDSSDQLKEISVYGYLTKRAQENILDERQANPEEDYIARELAGSIYAALGSLDETKSRVLLLRYGLSDGVEHSYHEVAELLGLTERAVKGLETRALRNLRHPPVGRTGDHLRHEDRRPTKRKEIAKLCTFPVDAGVCLISTKIYEELIRSFRTRPDALKTLDRRKFEEIIAELFAGFGYEVELTGRTRDGGRDIIAIKDKEVHTKFIIEAKRPDPKNPVPIGTVRALYGVKCDEKATKAILATTTYFTRDARLFFDRHKWELEPRDFGGIMSWIDTYLQIKAVAQTVPR